MWIYCKWCVNVFLYISECIDNCKKLGLVFENVVGISEVINSRDVQLQVQNKHQFLIISLNPPASISISIDSTMHSESIHRRRIFILSNSYALDLQRILRDEAGMINRFSHISFVLNRIQILSPVLCWCTRESDYSLLLFRTVQALSGLIASLIIDFSRDVQSGSRLDFGCVSGHLCIKKLTPQRNLSWWACLSRFASRMFLYFPAC